jgi:hypothetical protein
MSADSGRNAMTQHELAKRLRISYQLMCNLEANRRKFRREHVEALDELWDAKGHFVRLWIHSQREHDREWFRKYAAFEHRSREIKIWQATLIPGLFQTADYARSLVVAARTPNVEDVVEIRMRRQDILTREDPPLVYALIDEKVLRQPAPGVEAMRDQLRRLLEIASLPNVIVQIVPMTSLAHTGLDGGFILLDQGGDDGQIAFTEAQLSGRLVRDEEEVRALTVRYDLVRAKALSEDDSLRLIATIMESMR